MTILDKIIDNKRKEVKLLKEKYKIKDFEKMGFFSTNALSLKSEIQSSKFGIISEIKRKSPSAGEINTSISPKDLAISYQKSGASGISVLTDLIFLEEQLKI